MKNLLLRLACYALLCAVCLNANAQTTFPTLVRYSQPSGVSAPGEMFTPPLQGSAATNAPQVGEWTRTAGPDESVILTGSSLSRYSGAEEGKDTRFLVYGAGGTQADAAIQRMDGDKAVITMPPSLSRWGMYLVWPVNDAGMGSPIAVNKTEAWWVGPDKAPAGTTSSVFGRNLANQNGTSLSYVYIKSTTSGAGQWAQVTKVNPYKVDFTIPANLANGDYEVWTHNGHGGEYGWSGPHKLTVSTAVRYSGPTINVKDYGARGDGQSDDLAAINRALAAVRASAGATLYFPAGTYMISGMLEPSSNTRWKGEGMNQTIIKCNNNFQSQYGVVFGRVDNFEMSDLTFDGNKNYRGGVWHPIYLRASNNLRINNVRLSFLHYNVLDVSDSRHVFVNGCELIGKMSLLGSVNQIFIDGCTFRISNDTDMGMQLGGSNGVSLTNSTCQDYDASNYNDNTGIGKGRFVTGTGNWGANHNTYFGNNTTKDLGPVPASGDQNAGEQFMWEGNWTNYIGTVASSSATTTSLNGFSMSNDMTRFAVIIKGKGLGQSRRITGYSGNTITVAEPWNVVPDGSSTVVVGQYINNVVVYGNFLDGKSRAVTEPNHMAVAGIEPYGGTLNFVAANNTLQDLRQGTSNWALQEGTGLAPNYFSVYTNNTYKNVRWAMHTASDVRNNFGTAIIGTVYRRSNVQQVVASSIHADVNNENEQFIDAAVYEHNTYDNVSMGFSTGWVNHPNEVFGATALKNQVLYKNSFNGNGKTAINLSPKMALRENKFSGFQTVYNGSLTTTVVEAPTRVIEIKTNTTEGKGQLVIWNAGTKELNWSATTDASWLKLGTASGKIEHQGAQNTIEITANTAGLPAGTHKANVRVQEGSQTKVYTVVLITDAKQSNTPPAVTIKSPTSDSSYNAPATITIKADASDKDGSINKVEFFNGSSKIGEDVTAPYEFTWKGVEAGSYTITAKATDNNGLSTTSGSVNVKVKATNVAPKVTLTSPKDKDQLKAPATIVVTAEASDADGSIAKVEFYSGNTKVGEDATAPYSIAWKDVAAGKYTLKAVAIDNENAKSTSNEVSFVVTETSVAPSIAIISPKANSQFEAPANVSIEANVSTQNGSIAVVEFFNGTNKIGEAKAAPYAVALNNLKAGNYTITVKATNSAKQTTSSDIKFTVTDPVKNIAPTVTLTAGSNVSNLTAPAKFALTANVSDKDGSVVLVEFFNGKEKIGEATSQPFVLSLENMSAGSYTFTARAKDDKGAQTTSGVINVTVKAGTEAPTVALTAPVAVQTYTAPARIEIAANASDKDGSITKVEFYANGKKIGEALKSPYAMTWNNIAEGSYKISAKAYDNTNLSSETKAVTVTVGKKAQIAPKVSLTANGSSFNIPANITLSADATDEDGKIAKVEFFANDIKIGEDATAPYSLSWNKVNVAGTYTIVAKATDNNGLTATSEVVTITLNKGNQAPTIVLKKEGNGENETSEVKLVADANDADGTIAKVEFYQNGTKVGEAKTRPYAYTARNLAPGTYSFIAKAFDNEGLSSQSAAVTVTIAKKPTPKAPVVSLKASKTTATTKEDVVLTADAKDEDGKVVKVEFFVSNQKFGEANSAPFEFIGKGMDPGVYPVVAKATDNSGLTSVSNTVTVTIVKENVVKENIAPVVSIQNPISNSSYILPSTVQVSANATDKDGSIKSVEFYANSKKIGESNKAPYRIDWKPEAQGTYSITAKATDNQGKSTTSSSVPVNIHNNGFGKDQPSFIKASPNPFANSTTLELTSPQRVFVSVKLLNQRGDVVANLFDGQLQQGQSIKLNVNGSHLPNGTYTVAMMVNDGKQYFNNSFFYQLILAR